MICKTIGIGEKRHRRRADHGSKRNGSPELRHYAAFLQNSSFCAAQPAVAEIAPNAQNGGYARSRSYKDNNAQ
jgi:hypothetical protein